LTSWLVFSRSSGEALEIVIASDPLFFKASWKEERACFWFSSPKAF